MAVSHQGFLDLTHYIIYFLVEFAYCPFLPVRMNAGCLFVHRQGQKEAKTGTQDRGLHLLGVQGGDLGPDYSTNSLCGPSR